MSITGYLEYNGIKKAHSLTNGIAIKCYQFAFTTLVYDPNYLVSGFKTLLMQGYPVKVETYKITAEVLVTLQAEAAAYAFCDWRRKAPTLRSPSHSTPFFAFKKCATLQIDRGFFTWV